MRPILVALLLLSSTQQRRDVDLKVGDLAPNIKAKALGQKTEVELKEIVEKEKRPVVLIFGSYT